MKQDDYFSFGDEELDLADPERELPDQALALAEPPDAARDGDGLLGPAAKRAARSRGDSEQGSSERRRPSSRQARGLAAIALGLLALLFVRIALSALGGADPAAQNPAGTSTRHAAPSTADLEARRRAEAARASRERAAERQRARQHRARTRRRARRRRRVAEGRRRAKERRSEKQAREEAAVEAPAPEYVPPAYESSPPPSAPAPEPAPEPPGEGHLHDGSSSPEFGL